MNRVLFLLIIIMCCVMQLEGKVRILTFHYNKPDFIELQVKACKHFLEHDFEILVFNDAADPTTEIAIRETCEKYSIQCIRYYPEWHKDNPLNNRVKSYLDNPQIYTHVGFNNYPRATLEDISINFSIRHSHVIQYALDHYGYDHDDIIVILDGDAFPIRPLNLYHLLANNPIVGINRLIQEDNVDYLWVPFIAFNPKVLPNLRDLRFSVSAIKNKVYDTGSESYHYLENNSSVCARKILGYSSTGFYAWQPTEIKRYGFTHDEIWLIKNLPWPNCVEFHIDNHILHFGASSFEPEGHDVKAAYMKAFFERILGRVVN
jgi:glycosyltransferase involved in cell wall biosynthesis